MAKDLIDIYQDIPKRQKSLMTTDFWIYAFDQLWGSTALGFSGVGGAALTHATTYILIPKEAENIAYVYFGNRFAYKCPANEEFLRDVRAYSVASVNDSKRYFKKENEL